MFRTNRHVRETRYMLEKSTQSLKQARDRAETSLVHLEQIYFLVQYTTETIEEARARIDGQKLDQ